MEEKTYVDLHYIKFLEGDENDFNGYVSSELWLKEGKIGIGLGRGHELCGGCGLCRRRKWDTEGEQREQR